MTSLLPTPEQEQRNLFATEQFLLELDRREALQQSGTTTFQNILAFSAVSIGVFFILKKVVF